MCSGASLADFVNDFVVTKDWRLVLSDVDHLVKRANNVLVRCRERIRSPMAAPEQLSMDGQGYDEKVDIWKVPDILAHIMEASGLTGTNV